ncbi:MAG TPA: sarcosine oxidase subunit delta [Micropepsaceae bacterium]|jgi:sarcosine oxidase subunit delta|nr:sarcosine oxidase subunit delta [Micropepsaceae bacterium]
MRIPCPFCGLRDAEEFAVLGSDPGPRPDPNAPDAPARFSDYVHVRDNPAGTNREFWYHASGCRRWLRVVRDTRTHDIIAAELVSP